MQADDPEEEVGKEEENGNNEEVGNEEVGNEECFCCCQLAH